MLDPDNHERERLMERIDNHERERLMERMRKNEGETGGQTQIYLFTAVFCENKLKEPHVNLNCYLKKK